MCVLYGRGLSPRLRTWKSTSNVVGRWRAYGSLFTLLRFPLAINQQWAVARAPLGFCVTGFRFQYSKHARRWYERAAVSPSQAKPAVDQSGREAPEPAEVLRKEPRAQSLRGERGSGRFARKAQYEQDALRQRTKRTPLRNPRSRIPL